VPSPAGLAPGAAPLQVQPQVQIQRGRAGAPDQSNPVGPTGGASGTQTPGS
jgi:hypothetical protein